MAKRPRERIYLVPRWPGLVFAFVLLVIFAVGFAQASARDYTRSLGIALLVAGVVALIQSNENLSGISITASRSTPTPAGEHAQIELTLRNDSPRERIGLQVRRALKWRTAWLATGPPGAELPVLGPGESAVVRLPLATSRRGRYAIPDLWVCSIMPVGLCFAWKVFQGSGDYFVYPPPRGIGLDPSTNEKGRHRGDGATGGSEDVTGHRPYEAGDPLSRLDWRVFARTGKLAVRTLEEGRGGEVALRWEDTRFLEDTEARLSQLSYWIDQCAREERPFRLELLHEGPSELNSRNVAGCREALATFSPA